MEITPESLGLHLDLHTSVVTMETVQCSCGDFVTMRGPGAAQRRNQHIVDTLFRGQR
jgi:hypothetical protein